jgi:hypothetical protein
MAVSKKVRHRSKRRNVRRHPQYPWAKDLEKNVYSHLSSIKSTIKTSDGTNITVSKYHHQASQILEDMIAGVETFPYQIHFSDLTPQLNMQLLGIALKDYVISGVVHKMMMYANPNLYKRAEKLRGAFPCQWIIC